ncbi:MAG: PhzF family phenazine biosynthesis protein [Chloroflexi bacterium]|nr:PhzF family phenazine biosynthesis protein [Chloroflexota bacterium]
MKEYKVVYLDAFTSVPFAGNPCAVLPNAAGLTDEQMQAIARETNLSETSFVLPSTQADFRVRYFTPQMELPFAGHPTIATSFMLAQEGMILLQEPVTRIMLEFEIGVLPVDIHVQDGQPVGSVMTQQPPTFGPQFTAEETAPCFSLAVSDLRPDCLPQIVGTGVSFLIVPARDVEVLGKIKMNRAALAALCARGGVHGAFVFSIGGFDLQVDTHARLFNPHGAGEDPFTGSASGAMGAYVVHYGLKPGPKLVAEQGHFVGRPGQGVLEIGGTPDEITSVRLGGAAVKTLEGTLFVS